MRGHNRALQVMNFRTRFPLGIRVSGENFQLEDK